jgi:hypothetical protein
MASIGRMLVGLAALAIGLSAVSPTHGQTAALGLAREAELQQLSVCPERPTVGVIAGTGAGMFITSLFEGAGGATDLVERARLDEITDELCLGPTFDPATIAPSGGLLFAQYLVEVEADLNASPAPVSVHVVRVDTGAVIFEASDTLAPVTLDALDTFLQDSVSGLLAAVAANGYACSPSHAETIAEPNCSCGLPVWPPRRSYLEVAVI